MRRAHGRPDHVDHLASDRVGGGVNPSDTARIAAERAAGRALIRDLRAARCSLWSEETS
jgi:hypothetical protein